MTGKLIYVTGIPGTGVYRALEKYRDWRQLMGKPRPEIVSLEKDFLEIQQADAVEQLFETPRADVRILEVLLLPRPVLRRGWSEAFASAIERATEIRESGTDVFLTFHATWYHLANREYISAVDFALGVKPECRAEYAVTLIDDIYDVRNRLSIPHGLFNPSWSEKPLLDSVLKLNRLLDWRRVEDLMTERWASVCVHDGRSLMFATKHPASTFDDLLYSDKKVVYMAHPISELRRGFEQGGTQRSDAQSTINTVSEMASQLRSRVALIEPTTIDELRFQIIDTPNETAVPAPRLTGRWALPAGGTDTLYEAPPGGPDLIPGAGQAEYDRLVERALRDEADDSEWTKLEDAIHLVQVLRQDIQEQIKSRDFALIEQADGLAIYRPVFNGHVSRGVREEVRFHGRLVKVGDSRRMAVILHLPEDEVLFARLFLRHLVIGWLKAQTLTGDAGRVDELMAEGDSFIDDLLSADTPYGAGSALVSALEELDIHINVSGTDGSAFADDPAIVARHVTEQLGSDVKSGCISYLQDLKGAAQVKIIEADLTPAQFASQVKGELVA